MNLIKCRRGFTLIELLVVVLIIGILAAIALPMYEKAVLRARFVEVTTTYNSLIKGFDLYLLENPFPSESILTLLGSNASASLEVEPPCLRESTDRCYTKLGMWGFDCMNFTMYGQSHHYCEIFLNTNYNSDGTTGNQWFKADGSTSAGALRWYKNGSNSPWRLDVGSVHPSLLPDVCSWWQSMSSEHQTAAAGSMGKEISNDCAPYFD